MMLSTLSRTQLLALIRIVEKRWRDNDFAMFRNAQRTGTGDQGNQYMLN